MKLSKWMCLVAACMIAVPAFGKRKVPLHGKWITKGKTVILDLPIEGSLEERTGELTLAFMEDYCNGCVWKNCLSGNSIYRQYAYLDGILR